MTTHPYSPFVLNSRDLFLHGFRDINFSLFRSFQDSSEVKVSNLSNMKSGIITLKLEESRFLWRKSESYILRFEGKKIPISKLKDYAPQVSSDEVFYYCVYDHFDSCALLNSKGYKWCDVSTENETRYINEYGTVITEIWKIKNNEEWPYIFNNESFKSKTFIRNEHMSVFVPSYGMININDTNLGIAISNEKINILVELNGNLCHIESYQWKIDNAMYVNYKYNGIACCEEIPKTTIHVTNPKIQKKLDFLFVIVKGKEARFVPMNRIFTSGDRIWEKIAPEMTLSEIEEGYRQIRVSEETNFVSGQQVISRKYGRAAVSSVLIDINDKFSGKILISIGKTYLVVSESDLSFFVN